MNIGCPQKAQEEDEGEGSDSGHSQEEEKKGGDVSKYLEACDEVAVNQ